MLSQQLFKLVVHRGPGLSRSSPCKVPLTGTLLFGIYGEAYIPCYICLCPRREVQVQQAESLQAVRCFLSCVRPLCPSEYVFRPVHMLNAALSIESSVPSAQSGSSPFKRSQIHEKSRLCPTGRETGQESSMGMP